MNRSTHTNVVSLDAFRGRQAQAAAPTLSDAQRRKRTLMLAELAKEWGVRISFPEEEGADA